MLPRRTSQPALFPPQCPPLGAGGALGHALAGGGGSSAGRTRSAKHLRALPSNHQEWSSNSNRSRSAESVRAQGAPLRSEKFEPNAGHSRALARNFRAQRRPLRVEKRVRIRRGSRYRVNWILSALKELALLPRACAVTRKEPQINDFRSSISSTSGSSTSSTRRFCWRSASVALPPTGSVSP